MKIIKSDCGVWMIHDKPFQSAARELTERVMRAVGVDPNDFRLRDAGIMAIVDDLNNWISGVNIEEKSSSPSNYPRILTEKQKKQREKRLLKLRKQLRKGMERDVATVKSITKLLGKD